MIQTWTLLHPGIVICKLYLSPEILNGCDCFIVYTSIEMNTILGSLGAPSP